MSRQTSIDAYRHLIDGGTLSASHARIYAIVYEHGPLTINETFEHILHLLAAQRFNYNAHARFTEMRAMGILKEEGTRICTVTGRNVLLWDVTDRAEPLPRPPIQAKMTYKQLEAENAELRRLLAAVGTRPRRSPAVGAGQLPLFEL